jgi:hypothetical protein
MILIGVRCQITWRPSLFSIGPMAELLFYLSLAPICFSKLLKDYSKAAENKQNLSAAREYV